MLELERLWWWNEKFEQFYTSIFFVFWVTIVLNGDDLALMPTLASACSYKIFFRPTLRPMFDELKSEELNWASDPDPFAQIAPL